MLVVEDDPTVRRATVELIAGADVKVDEAGTGEQALQALRTGGHDCVVMGIGLPDLDGARIKGVRSDERLLDEVSLFLHRVVSRMPEEKRQAILALHDTNALPRDKKVLIVDDDMRTTFAMSHFLAERGMKTLKAEHGERALHLLEEHPDVDLVLMDIMMPVMDGYETIRRIRAQERFRTLPIIALTAKAMPEDREKCLAAGASDYMAKPVDQARLVSLLRVWLCK